MYPPAPRLWQADLNPLIYARSLDLGQVGLIEPTSLRQSFAQLLTLDVRSKKDPYTRATPTNDVSHNTCRSLKEKIPTYSSF